MTSSEDDTNEYDNEPDEELVARCQSGDRVACDALFRRHYPALYQFLLKLVRFNNHRADDLAQDTCLKAQESLRSQKVSNFKAWLFKIAHHLAIDAWRRDTRFRWLPLREQPELDEQKYLVDPGPEQRMEEEDFIDTVMQYVSPKYRECVRMDIFEDIRQWEIAERLGMSERNVRKYVFEGKKELRLAFGPLICVDTSISLQVLYDEEEK